jgi:hypothetical protein
MQKQQEPTTCDTLLGFRGSSLRRLDDVREDSMRICALYNTRLLQISSTTLWSSILFVHLSFWNKGLGLVASLHHHHHRHHPRHHCQRTRMSTRMRMLLIYCSLGNHLDGGVGIGFLLFGAS